MPEQLTGCLVAVFVIAAGALPRQMLSNYTSLRGDLLNVVSVLCSLCCFGIYFALFGKIFGDGKFDKKPKENTKREPDDERKRKFVEGETEHGFYIDTSKKQ